MKRIVLFVMLIMCAASLSAQQWSLTPEIGMTAVKRSGYSYVGFGGGYSWSPRMKVGLGVEYSFRPGWFALKSGLYYTQRGFGVYDFRPLMYGSTNDADLEFVRFKETRHILQLPVLADFSFRLSDDVRLHLAVGPYIAASVSDRIEMYYTGYKDYNDGGYGYWDAGADNRRIRNINSLDWGVSMQAGIEVKQWVVNCGYDLSLGKEFRYDEVGLKYHTLSLSVGYKFKLGK